MAQHSQALSRKSRPARVVHHQDRRATRHRTARAAVRHVIGGIYRAGHASTVRRPHPGRGTRYGDVHASRRCRSPVSREGSLSAGRGWQRHFSVGDYEDAEGVTIQVGVHPKRLFWVI